VGLTARKKKNMPPQTNKKPTVPNTQKYLDIAAIRDGVVILKDGSLRHVLMVLSWFGM
jgi:hypothetical protein